MSWATFEPLQKSKIPEIPDAEKITFENIRYGMLVEYLHTTGGYHSGVKVHFFNKKGALIGNFYQFVPYNQLRKRPEISATFPRYFMGKNYLKKYVPFSERLKTWLFIGILNIVTVLIRFTQKYMD